jgi:hypothetical protein
MTRLFNTVNDLQKHLKGDIANSVMGQVQEVATETVQRILRAEGYIGQDPTSYDRTWELLNSVTVGNISVGTKYVTFEIFMDTDKINAYAKNDDNWNQHASVDPIDVSEYIPLWVEEGTDGSLWDREGSYYMKGSWNELNDGKLAQAFASELRSRGWNVTVK